MHLPSCRIVRMFGPWPGQHCPASDAFPMNVPQRLNEWQTVGTIGNLENFNGETAWGKVQGLFLSRQKLLQDCIGGSLESSIQIKGSRVEIKRSSAAMLSNQWVAFLAAWERETSRCSDGGCSPKKSFLSSSMGSL